MLDHCSCGALVPPEKRECQACGEPFGYPNVRAAAAPSEKKLLDAAVENARISARARCCEVVLNEFGAAVEKSRAVIARSLGVVQDIVLNNRTYTSYHQQLTSGARVSEGNIYDLTRAQIDSALFPNYHWEIRFASLTLAPEGLSAYGDYIMVLKEPLIAKRATVFVENPVNLLKKIYAPLDQPFPSGHRAVWADRGLMAQAKLHSEISSATNPSEFPGILTRDRGGTANSDYIEVHIYGPISLNSLQSVVGPVPQRGPDRTILKDIQARLASVGAALIAA